MLRKLTSIFRSNSKTEPQIHLAAFGKHPGWKDHMDELGLTTDRLISLRRLLYVEGINSNIDSGAWRDLEPDHLVERFNHIFVWTAGKDILIGRMWTSSDGRGRKLYPMIVAVHCIGITLESALDLVIPRLEMLESRLTATDSPDEVRTIIHSTEKVLTALTKQISVSGRPASEPGYALRQLVQYSELGPDFQGLHRVFYQIDREMGDLKKSRGDSRSTATSKAPSHHLRLPKCGERETEAATLWLRFLSDLLPGPPPVLTFLPLEYDWVDLIIGLPTASQLFCLRATPQRLPLTTDIPYSIDSDFIDQTNLVISNAGAKSI